MPTAFHPTNILLPAENVDMTRWSVVACDQFTGEPGYWEETERIVGDSPSTLRLTLPEIYLGKPDTDARIAEINKNIESYLSSGIFREFPDSMIYVRRIQSDGKLREGIVGAVDLEQYDYRAGSTSQIRATEATVAERIPPRLKIRENAAIELPHIMILIDDPGRTVIEPLSGRIPELRKLYDFDLMQGGGSISGYLLRDSEISAVDSALGELSKKSELLFAMGDGNHSLATAKEHYERLKRENPGVDMSDHPARYALCEIVNLHSPALEFEAIHRIVTGVNPGHLLEKMAERLMTSPGGDDQSVTVVTGETEQVLTIKNPLSKLAVGSLQTFLDEYLGEFGGEIDYIHGKEVLKNLAKAPDSVGFILEPMDKSDLFPAVIHDGALPRKTFSMGHAEDKRYYLEGRPLHHRTSCGGPPPEVRLRTSGAGGKAA